MTINSKKKLPRGVKVRQYFSGKTAIQISFTYQSIECRETLKNLKATKANIKYAARLREEILISITKGTFDYSDYFPYSNRVKLFGHTKRTTVLKSLLEEYLNLAKVTVEHSTYLTYNRIIKRYLIPHLGEITIKDLSSRDIRNMIKELKKYDRKNKTYVTLKAKTIKNILIPLAHVIAQALTDDLIHQNPLDGVVLNKILPKESFNSDYIIDPFHQEEIQFIINSLKQPEKNMVQFWFFTGLRPSELMGLEWKDINFEKGTVFIDRAIVLKRLKDPKTKAGKREIMLLPPALAALKQQKYHTLIADGRVFLNPNNNTAWNHDQQLRDWWLYTLKRIGIRYRNPYQCRHTFASTMLSNGENMLWVANQLGHVDTEMVIKIYGKWIPDNSLSTGYRCKNDWGNFLKIQPLQSVI